MRKDPKILNFLAETLTNKGKDATEQRLVQGAQIMLRNVALAISLPAAVMHIALGWGANSSEEARFFCNAWLFFLIPHFICCYIVTRLPSGRVRAMRALLYVSAAFQMLGVAVFIHTTGGLMSPTVVFIPVMTGAYRVFLDFWMGLFVTVFGLFIYLLVISLQIFAGASTTSYFPDLVVPFYQYPWASLGAALTVASTCVLCFGGINYGMNQSALLHRYITESVLRRYLPPSLVERAALGELRLDAPPERRVVTVMFVDLVGFTGISETMSPEAVGQMLNLYLSRAMELAHRYQATVDKFIGDSVMYVFGAPDSLAPEIQVQRAIQLAQAITAALDSSKQPVRLKARIGINTGDVVVGNFGNQLRSDYTVLGHTVNLASRLEAACEPEQILVGPETARYAAGEFDLQPTEKLRLKGISQPVIAYYVRSKPSVSKHSA